MSIILNPMPDFLEVGGEKILIDTDFRTWIRFDEALFWSDKPVEKRLYCALDICYDRKIPADINSAVHAAIGFYAPKDEPLEEVGKKPQAEQGISSRSRHIYSFTHDASLIYAAFMAQYGIDLTKDDMHWWLFRALFEGLTDENRICKVMEIRSIDLSKIKDKEQKAHYRRLKRIYRLPDPRCAEEQEADMINALSVMF